MTRWNVRIRIGMNLWHVIRVNIQLARDICYFADRTGPALPEVEYAEKAVHSRPSAKFFSLRTDQGREIKGYIFRHRLRMRIACLPCLFTWTESEFLWREMSGNIDYTGPKTDIPPSVSLSNELVFYFHRCRTLTEVEENSQHLNSCIVKVYL